MPAGAEGRQRLGLPAGTVEGKHQQPKGPLAQGLLLDKALELSDHDRVGAELEVGFEPLLERVQSQVGEPAAGGIRERLAAELGERRSAPERERVAQQLGAADGVSRLARRLRQRLEPGEVDLLRIRRDEIAGRTRLDRGRS